MNKAFKFPSMHETFNQSTIRILYYKNKMYTIPVVAIFISVLLIFFAVVPQVQEYFALKDQEKNIQERITILKSNTSFLSSINDADINNTFQMSLSALPVEKDFDGILTAIGQAASDANVTLGDFSLQIGDLSAQSTKVTTALPLEVVLTINSGLSGTREFLAALARRLPLSEAANIKSGDVSSTVTVIYYYKPIPVLSFDGTQKLVPFSQKQNAIVKQLSSFAQ